VTSTRVAAGWIRHTRPAVGAPPLLEIPAFSTFSTMLQQRLARREGAKPAARATIRWQVCPLSCALPLVAMALNADQPLGLASFAICEPESHEHTINCSRPSVSEAKAPVPAKNVSRNCEDRTERRPLPGLAIPNHSRLNQFPLLGQSAIRH